MSEVELTIEDLPVKFNVKYLGFEPARGLWGMKHTRKPVDVLVAKAKNLPPTAPLPRVIIEVTKDSFAFSRAPSKSDQRIIESEELTIFDVNEISYGVQDLVYTRVFSMITVQDVKINEGSPFICHSFVCDSKNDARQITYALAAVFKEFALNQKKNVENVKVRRFAIDLRTPEQQALAAEAGENEEESDV